MKSCWKSLLALPIVASLSALVAGCQSSPLNAKMSRADQAKFQQKVAQDPFPAAQPTGFAGG
jgi:hypothetical protein